MTFDINKLKGDVADAQFMKNIQGGDWDELANGFESHLRTQIAESANMADIAYRTVVEAGTNTPEFQTLATGAMRDLQIYADKFGALVSRRGGRTGRTRNSEEYTDYMTIGLELTSLREELQIVVGHTLLGLTEAHNNALEVLRARQAAQEEVATQAAPLGEDTIVSSITPETVVEQPIDQPIN